MQVTRKNIHFALAVAATFLLAGPLPNTRALAQAPSTSSSAALPESTIKALQEALNKQGIAVKTDGVLNDDTRAAIKKYQTLHHLPVTGEPDPATLGKLGVARQGAAADAKTPQGQAGTTSGAGSATMGPQMMQGGMMSGGMMSGGMMNCPMMPGQAQARGPGMAMQGQSGQAPQGGMMMNPEMMQGMMQMMSGMMQMMQTQMQQGQMQPGQMGPGQTQPGSK